MSLAAIRSTPLSTFWRHNTWTEVDMSHLSHNAIGFALIEYCDQQFGKDEWTGMGDSFYFKNKNDAVIFTLRWV